MAATLNFSSPRDLVHHAANFSTIREQGYRLQSFRSLAIWSGGGRSLRSSSGTDETIRYVATPIGLDDSFSAYSTIVLFFGLANKNANRGVLGLESMERFCLLGCEQNSFRVHSRIAGFHSRIVCELTPPDGDSNPPVRWRQFRRAFPRCLMNSVSLVRGRNTWRGMPLNSPILVISSRPAYWPADRQINARGFFPGTGQSSAQIGLAC